MSFLDPKSLKLACSTVPDTISDQPRPRSLSTLSQNVCAIMAPALALDVHPPNGPTPGEPPTGQQKSQKQMWVFDKDLYPFMLAQC